jgi:NADH-quinone oxidoreductase subunit E
MPTWSRVSPTRRGFKADNRALQGRQGHHHSALAAVQEKIGYLSQEALDFLSKEMDIPAAEMFGVATFYGYVPPAAARKACCPICRGTACHVQGSLRVGKCCRGTSRSMREKRLKTGFSSCKFVACLGCSKPGSRHDGR